MKQFNLSAKKVNFPFGELNVITLGERGRGRFEAIVPFQDGLVENENVIDVPTKSGKVKIIKGGDSNGWIARISCKGVYTRHSEGNAYVHIKDADKVKVLAYGYGAEGDAGRLGTWGDYLLKIEDNTLIKVKRHGGHKTPPYYVYFGQQKALTMSGNELEIFLDGQDYEYDLEDDSKYFVKIK